jgi:heme O synthase-like polyprenyltransferase
MQNRMTTKTCLLAAGVWILLMLAVVEKAMSHQWNLIVSVLGGLGASVLAVALAFGVGRSPVQSNELGSESAGRQFRNSVVLWVALFIGLLVLMKILDALHVPWQQWLK